MASTINTNIPSLNAQRNLSASAGSLTTSMQRLSSGLRVNSAKDDAAGFDGEDAVNLVIAESVRKRLPNMACEGGINAVVEEALDADNAAGEDVTVLKNALLKFLHGVIPAFFADFFVGCNCCVSAPG